MKETAVNVYEFRLADLEHEDHFKRLNRALTITEGVAKVDFDVAEKRVVVTCEDSVDEGRIMAVVEKAGFRPSKA